MRIWVDLTNSPHVLVFRPLIAAMRSQGHQVEVTARDFAQTIGLCERFGIESAEIGHHRGGRLSAKAVGLASRSYKLMRWAKGRGFDLALGHGSNDITVAAKLLGVPSATMFDYEYAKVQHGINCRLARRVIVPDAIPKERLYGYGARGKISTYPGLKEEYYLADFKPEPAVIEQLGLKPERPVVVMRTAPEVSLYHRFENDIMSKLINRLGQRDDLQVVLLPRTEKQRQQVLAHRASRLIVPEQAIDAQSLIAYADLLIGAGGTMNREAVALATPVYTTFEGRIGAVDQALIDEGRLSELHDPDKVVIEKKPTVGSERIRRDPQLLVNLLLGLDDI